MARPILFVFISFLFLSCSDDVSQDNGETDLTNNSNKSPNVLLIIMDDVGVDAFPKYDLGAEKPPMPNMVSLMEEGLVFDNVWAYPTCSPTRAAILTGKQSVNNGVFRPTNELSTDHISLQKYISNHTNYDQAVIGKWHLSDDMNHPKLMGIPYFEGTQKGSIPDYYNYGWINNYNEEMVNTYATTQVTDRAIAWIKNRVNPWFMWVAYHAGHTPFHVPPSNLYSGNLPAYTDSSDAKTYLFAMLEAMDNEVGRMLESLDEKTREQTVVIVIGDNGTSGQAAQLPYGKGNAKGTIMEGGIRVPMFVWGNGVRSGRSSVLFCASDLYATIASICGIEVSSIYDSFNFEDFLYNDSTGKRSYAYSELVSGNEPSMKDAYAVRNNTYKLIIHPNNENEKLYNLVENPEETVNLLNRTMTSQDTQAYNQLKSEANRIRN